MEIKRALEIISLLADGIDPCTGEVFPKDSPYQNPDTIRALFLAINGLKKIDSKDRKLKKLPERAGEPWSDQEDNNLIKKFDEKLNIKELSKLHERTEGAIRSRLIKLGKIII